MAKRANCDAYLPLQPLLHSCLRVLGTLEVVWFCRSLGLKGHDIYADPALQRRQFGGTITPMLKIEIDGNMTRFLGLP